MTAAEPSDAGGLEAREARWLAEEFAPGGGSTPALESAIRRRLAGEPLQYVIGHWPFRSLDLVVDPRVLIPRPETEWLVDVALRHVSGPVATVVDLGCGSGAVGLALATELAARGTHARVIGVDASADALAVAALNAERCGARLELVLGSWYGALDPALAGSVDLVVANPPYVGSDELPSLDPELAHEPRAALVARDRHGVAGFADVAVVIDGAPTWLA
ncbi:MAG TPA: HemK/PrmC family methyltransferase, partial [Acidimicrobiales bacterium]|nr:HemK/PrmC family methyltransferase [Acidimicrobiales bacterium]